MSHSKKKRKTHPSRCTIDIDEYMHFTVQTRCRIEHRVTTEKSRNDENERVATKQERVTTKISRSSDDTEAKRPPIKVGESPLQIRFDFRCEFVALSM